MVKASFTLAVVIAAVLLLAQPVLATDYYVDATDGDNGNTGLSAEQAWKTIAYMQAQSFSPGDNVYFQRGETWEETLTVPSGGTSGNPLTFAAYGTGADPVITGSDTRGTCITIDGDSNDYITVSGLNLQAALYYGIHLDNGPDHITIEDCTISNHGISGIQLYDADNTDDSTNLTIDGNTIASNVEFGISLLDDFDTVTVTNNTVHGNATNDGSAVESGIYIKDQGTLATNVVVTDNTVYDNGGTTYGSGIYLDTLAGDGTITAARNLSYDNFKSGITVELTDAANIHYNVVYGNDIGISMWRGCDSNKIYNNVAYGNATGISLDEDTGTCANNLVKNNLTLDNTVYEMRVDVECANAAGAGGNEYEYNGFGLETTNFIYWNAGTVATYSAFDTAYGSATNSLTTDPAFTNPGAGDFTLQAGSHAINAGVYVGLDEDIVGTVVPQHRAVDMGAYESAYTKESRYGPIPLIAAQVATGTPVTVQIPNVAHTSGYLTVRTENETATASMVVTVTNESALGDVLICTSTAITTETTTTILLGSMAAAAEGVVDACDYPAGANLNFIFTTSGVGADFDVSAQVQWVESW